ncbi:MAG TPA: NADH-ubiquinone oxidoreductase-F iron-sulfur binding region domain-containing protein [Thermoanaerobaculia bacterium]|nr:NADH-ubiquinone oxidoreductase-F iron-sulfur binding region domain-containing protein [Thermoanaerobaculia bacterium]
MDLHFTTDEPTAEEREAVDACLAALSGSAAPPPDLARRRQYLLPVLHALQERIGWISPGGLNHASRQLEVPPAEAFGVADFYALFETREQPPVAIHVCDDIGCRFQAGTNGETLCAAMEKAFGPPGQSPAGQVIWHRSPCLGLCERAPAALVFSAGPSPHAQALGPASQEEIETLAAGRPLPPMDLARSVPQLGEPGLTLLSRLGRVDPASLDDYRAAGGYLALRRAFEMGPERVVREVLDAKLVGRGGAAFPTGQKWQGVRSAPSPRYLICNADESEPGTFKDRVLMEGDPYALVEAITIAGFATGCERGFLYIRGEYPLATGRLRHAIATCYERGYLGADLLGHGVRFDLELRRGAGAYICGEETALMNSLEGRRGEPRNKPPFPTQAGLFGQPTVINNVETLVNVLSIVTHGGRAYAAVGTERSTGPKLFCVAGHVARPGVYEVPFGTTLRQLLERAGGPSGGPWRAILLGGAAGSFITPDQLDVPLTFEGTRAIGASLGSGVVMPFDETADLRQVLRRIAQFFRDESCGQCVPCRVGTVRQEELLARLAAERPLEGVGEEVALLKELGQVMRDASICGLGQTASSAVESALARFSLYLENR